MFFGCKNEMGNTKKKGIWILALLVGFLIFNFDIFAFKTDEEITSYAYKEFPVLKEENITVVPVKMIYVNWAGAYSVNKIQLNKAQIFGYALLDLIIEHELKHHECWKKYKNIDVEHKICFKK